jgi:hypothetical protein
MIEIPNSLTHAERLALSGMISICARDWGVAAIDVACIVSILVLGGLVAGALIAAMPYLPHWGGIL